MKILLVGSFYWDMYAPAFYKAWNDMGHEVKKIDYDDYHFQGNNIVSKFLNKIQNRYHLGFYMKKYNDDILKIAHAFQPDFVFLYRCYHIYGTTINKIKDKTIVFSYNNDDPFSGIPSKQYFRYFIDDAKYCRLNYVYRRKNIIDFKNINIENTKVLLPYFRKENNYYILGIKDIPLAFIGHFENDGRDQKILKMKEAGIPVKVFGDRWQLSPVYKDIQDIVFPAKHGSEYNKAINRVKILLVFFSKLNHDTYTRRCFEIPAAKGVMLSEYTDDMNELFPENECAVYFRTTDELITKSKWLLNNDAEIGRISVNAYQRVKEIGGSEYDRCQEIINDFNKIKKTTII